LGFLEPATTASAIDKKQPLSFEMLEENPEDCEKATKDAKSIDDSTSSTANMRYGGVPTAAKYLDWDREACCLHTLDTINGCALEHLRYRGIQSTQNRSCESEEHDD
jgi:hypothetical protein